VRARHTCMWLPFVRGWSSGCARGHLNSITVFLISAVVTGEVEAFLGLPARWTWPLSTGCWPGPGMTRPLAGAAGHGGASTCEREAPIVIHARRKPVSGPCLRSRVRHVQPGRKHLGRGRCPGVAQVGPTQGTFGAFVFVDSPRNARRVCRSRRGAPQSGSPSSRFDSPPGAPPVPSASAAGLDGRPKMSRSAAASVCCRPKMSRRSDAFERCRT